MSKRQGLTPAYTAHPEAGPRVGANAEKPAMGEAEIRAQIATWYPASHQVIVEGLLAVGGAGSLRAVARRHRMSVSLLAKWIRDVRAKLRAVERARVCSVRS